jgi:protein O-mannosyl-transferase
VIGLFLVLIVSYGNSFDNDWHFDDLANITENQNVHLKTLNVEDIRNSFTFNGKILRPAAYLSFALNYYVGGQQVFGYHIVNFSIHFLATVFLFLLIYGTLRLPHLRDRYGPYALPVAFLSSLFWATSPLQVTAVTVIVQRMASMCGLFYVMAMYFYLMGRTAEGTARTVLALTFSFLAASLSMGTKENAAMIPVTIFLYEVLFLQDHSRENIRMILKWTFLPALLILGIAIWYVFMTGILNGYQGRPFTLGERLLTEARVLVYYVSLLIYPAAERLALLHDISASKGLFQPWTTFLSISFILSLIIYALISVRRNPLVSFCILFFFLNHLIEGSIIPLELIFEHRNYIPSMFFFVFPSVLIIWAWQYLKSKPILRIALVLICVFLVSEQVYTVHVRNQIYRSDFSLWLDNALKFPKLSRPHVHLAKHYFEAGYMKTAFVEFSRAYELDNYASTFQKAEVEYDLGQMWRSIDQDEKAFAFYNKALRTYPPYEAPLVGIALIKWREGRLQEALAIMEDLLKKNPAKSDYHEHAAVLLFYLGRYGEAEREAVKALSMDGTRLQPLIIRAEILKKTESNQGAIQLWKEIIRKRPESLDAKLALTELYSIVGEEDNLRKIVGEVLIETKEQRIEDVIRWTERNVRYSAYRPNEKELLKIFHRSTLRDNQ